MRGIADIINLQLVVAGITGVVIVSNYAAAVSIVHRPMEAIDPCRLPQPSSSDFNTYCQVAYHEVPWLCDPAGTFSRTEAELMESVWQKELNVSSCFCRRKNPSGFCSNSRNSIRLAVFIVPQTSISAIDSCLSHSAYVDVYDMSAAKVFTFATAALAYGQEVLRRWQRECQPDIMMVFIQRWSPEGHRKPYVVRLFQNKLRHLINMPLVHSIRPDVTAFEAIMDEFSEAVRLIHSYVQVSSRDDSSWMGTVDNWGEYGGVPVWALLLGCGLVLLVFIVAWIGNRVTEHLAYDKQKKNMNSMRAAQERWRLSTCNGFGAAQGKSKRSTMMFRQFSGDRRGRYGAANGFQKI